MQMFTRRWRAVARPLAVSLCALVLAAAVGRAATASEDEFERFESAIAAQPENLKLAADYRQRIIASERYDRSIKFFERLSSRPGAGPNVLFTLALAYVDKVPAAGSIRQVYLGRDAMDAATRSITRQPSAVAYYVRGLINLYYNRFIFHRTQKGVDDLEQAKRMLAGQHPEPYHARVFIALGDGYLRLDNMNAARAAWREGLSRFPDNDALRSRVAADGQALRHIIDVALDPHTRVDTSLRELFPSAVATSGGQ